MERSVTNELTNFSSTTQGYKMQLSVSQSWTVSPFVPKEYKNAIISALGSWGNSYSKNETFPAALAALRARGVTTLATALYRSRPLDEAGNDFPGGLCVVIGSEGQGLTDRTVEACDMAVRIPMTDRVESLNAAVAGSVLLWHFRGV